MKPQVSFAAWMSFSAAALFGADRAEQIKAFRAACEKERPTAITALQTAITDAQKTLRASERAKIDPSAPGIVEDATTGALRYRSKEQKVEQIAYHKKSMVLIYLPHNHLKLLPKFCPIITLGS